MPSGTQVPSTVTGCPTRSPGNGSSGPSTSSSGTGSARVRSTASAARCVLPRVELPEPEHRRRGHAATSDQEVRAPVTRGEGEARRHSVRTSSGNHWRNRIGIFLRERAGAVSLANSDYWSYHLTTSQADLRSSACRCSP